MILFLDETYVMVPDCCAAIEALFTSDPEVTAVTGNLRVLAAIAPGWIDPRQVERM